jgi:Spy/CpxP family protein refolding chaperone
LKKYYFFIVLIFSINILNAQTHSHHSSETGQEIKALTSEQINSYLNGEGMGLAKAAELNNFPGPKHVLDLAKELKLSQAQIDSTERIYVMMNEKAVYLGKIIIEKEKKLNQLFSSGKADKVSVKNLVTEIADYQGELRFTHLNAHIQQKDILTSDQILTYESLRGY